jgi:hypothetical protein
LLPLSTKNSCPTFHSLFYQNLPSNISTKISQEFSTFFSLSLVSKSSLKISGMNKPKFILKRLFCSQTFRLFYDHSPHSSFQKMNRQFPLRCRYKMKINRKFSFTQESFCSEKLKKECLPNNHHFMNIHLGLFKTRLFSLRHPQENRYIN